METKGGKLLLIEDDQEIIRSLTSLCSVELGLVVQSNSDGANGLSSALQEDFALVIVDANLPTKSGFEICRELRTKKPNQLIMFLTGRSEEIDKVIAFELGADDYVTKPFGARELVARIRALLRRAQQVKPTDSDDAVVIIGNLKIDTVSHRVWKNKAAVQLTLVEYELLVLLACNPGRSFQRRELLEIALGYSGGGNEEVLTVHFSRIRTKIEDDPSKPKYILTVRGVGYRFAAADEV